MALGVRKYEVTVKPQWTSGVLKPNLCTELCDKNVDGFYHGNFIQVKSCTVSASVQR